MCRPHRTITRLLWDAIIGLFMLAVGIPVQLIVAAIFNLGLFGVLSMGHLVTSDRWAVPALVGVWLTFTAAAVTDWYWFGTLPL